MNSSISFLISAALVGNLCASVFMTGIIFFIQIVQYPLLHNISTFDFSCYFKKSNYRISWIVYSALVIEIGFAIGLSFLPVRAVMQVPILITYMLLAAATLNTFLIQAPMTQRLQLAFDRELLSKVMFFNGVRLVTWTLRTILLCWIILFL